MDNPTIVTLDLRGTKFKTLKRTLDKLDFSDIGIFKTGDNEYFIDKDPRYFHIFLDFAKSGKSLNLQQARVLLVPENERPALIEEAREYGLCTCQFAEDYVQQCDLKCKFHHAKIAKHLLICNDLRRHTAPGYYGCKWWL